MIMITWLNALKGISRTWSRYRARVPMQSLDYLGTVCKHPLPSTEVNLYNIEHKMQTTNIYLAW
jgi:hypothetical protein